MFKFERSNSTRNHQRIRTRDDGFVVVESPIPLRRTLASRRPLALTLGGSVTVLAIWLVAVVSAGTAATGALPLTQLQGSAASTQRNTTTNAPQQPDNAARDTQPAKPNLPPLLQSRSSDTTLPISARPDGRKALSSSPTVLVVYVPDGYYPQPASARPPTTQAAQQTAGIVQQIAAGNEAKAVEQAKALKVAQPQYAADLASELQRVTQNSPRYNTVRQILIELDPALATRTQAQTQTQTQTQVQTATQNQAPAQTQQTNPAPPSRTNVTDKDKVAKVNALVMSTIPAYVKMPMGINEGTLQVNTLIAPTPAFLFDQQQIRAALCEIGSGEVVSVHDTIPAAWELKTTFEPRDPVRWFGVKDASGKIFYLPNYLDPVRDIQLGDRFVNKGGCNVELVAR